MNQDEIVRRIRQLERDNLALTEKTNDLVTQLETNEQHLRDAQEQLTHLINLSEGDVGARES